MWCHCPAMAAGYLCHLRCLTHTWCHGLATAAPDSTSSAHHRAVGAEVLLLTYRPAAGVLFIYGAFVFGMGC